jgi:hypothetical protein
MASQTGRQGTSQTSHPAGPSYIATELIPQGVRLIESPRGAPMLVMFTNPQQPRFGMGLTSITPPPLVQIIPGQGPIDRGM